jgi:hypothetical protein
MSPPIRSSEPTDLMTPRVGKRAIMSGTTMIIQRANIVSTPQQRSRVRCVRYTPGFNETSLQAEETSNAPERANGPQSSRKHQRAISIESTRG